MSWQQIYKSQGKKYENLRKKRKQIKYKKPKQKQVKIMSKKPKTKQQKAGRYYKAIRYHSTRSNIARAKDESKTSKKVYNTYNINWRKNPSKSDVKGVDTKKEKAKSHNEVYLFIKSVIPNTKKVSKTIIHVPKPMKNKAKRLQQIVNIRYRNIDISKRKMKNTPNDYRIKYR